MAHPDILLPATVDEAPIQAGLLRERLHLYAANVWAAVGGQLAVALLTVAVFSGSASWPALAGWLGFFMLTLALRVGLARRHQRARPADLPASRARLQQLRLALAATGLGWGVAGVLLFPSGDVQSQALLAFILAGVAAGSMTLTAFDLGSAFAFAALTLAPLSARLLAEGDSAAATMAAMVLIFVGLLGLAGTRVQRYIREAAAAREAAAHRAETLLENQRHQQRLAEEVRRQSDVLSVTLDSMDQGILSFDKDLRVHCFNRRASQLLDMPESFLAARPTLDEVASYQLEHGHYGENFGLVGEPARQRLEDWFAGKRDPFPEHYLRRTPSGQTLEVKTRYLDGGGLVRTFSDVTAFFDARERLLQSQEQLHKLALVAAHTDNAVVITDAGDRIEWVNEAFTRICGVAQSAALGRHVGELLRGPDTDLKAVEQMAQQMRRANKGSTELRYRRADGPVLWLALESHAVLDAHGTVQRYISIARDVTAQRAAEEQLRTARDEAERASRAKSEFLSAMSHELRTPMNAILGFAQLLDADPQHPLTTRQQAHVQQILHAGSHLLELINDVLDLARVESGKQSITVEPVALAPLLAECLELMRPLAQERAILLDRTPARPCSCVVAADRTRLTQVLLNVLSNAIKYNRFGGTVSVTCKADKDNLRIGIADTGQGLAPEQRARLFTAFERLGADGGPIEGAGIGLALSRRMLELMHGRIEVDSEAGRGSTFWITLPRSRAPAAAPVPAPVAPAAPDPQLPSAAARRVLYIEDNPINVMVMEAALEREPGVCVISAPLPELGLDLARTELPDLIMLDIHLPGMNGFEVLRRLRQSERTREIPVVAVSANAMSADIARAMAAGFDDYLTKPLNLVKLRETLHRGRVRPSADLEQPAADSTLPS